MSFCINKKTVHQQVLRRTRRILRLSGTDPVSVDTRHTNVGLVHHQQVKACVNLMKMDGHDPDLATSSSCLEILF